MKISLKSVLVLVALALSLVVADLAHAQKAATPASGLTFGRLKQHCLTTGPAGATRQYLKVVFTFFERGSTGAGAAALGISHSEFIRQLMLGLADLPRCARQLSNVS